MYAESRNDDYHAVTDKNSERMCYVTGKITKELYQKRQELGDEGFRKYIRTCLMRNK